MIRVLVVDDQGLEATRRLIGESARRPRPVRAAPAYEVGLIQPGAR